MKYTKNDYTKVIETALCLGAQKSSREGFVVYGGKDIDLTSSADDELSVAKNLLKGLR